MLSLHLGILAASLCPASPPEGDKLPPGPPWKTSWAAAHKQALLRHQPIFVYFTKTV